MEAFLPYIIQGLSGAIGGNVVGALRRTSSLGPLLNTLVGALGGIGAGQGLAASGQLDQIVALVGGNANLATAAAGLIGGFVLPFVASLFKRGG